MRVSDKQDINGGEDGKTNRSEEEEGYLLECTIEGKTVR